MSRPAIGCGTDGVIAMSSAAHGPDGITTGGTVAVGGLVARGRAGGPVPPVVVEPSSAPCVEGVVDEERGVGHLRRLVRPGRAVAGATEQPRDADHEQGGDAEHHQSADPVDAGGEPSARHSGHVGHASQRSRRFVPARRDVTTGVSGERACSQAALRSPGVRAPRTTPPVVRRARARPAVAAYDGHRLGRPGLGADAPADAGGPGAAGLRGLDGAVADPRLAGRLTRRGGDPRVGPARLPAAGDPAARRGHGDRRAARRRPFPTPTTRFAPCPASATTRPRPCWPSRSGAGRLCSTPTCAACWPGS